MRRRSTFVHDPALDINPQQFHVSADRFVVDKLPAAREERLTWGGFHELPEELWSVLQQSHELHIRWATASPYNATAPFISKTSPGLHVFYTPLPGQSGDLLCPLLRQIFSDSLKCNSPRTTFTTPSPPLLQYYSLLPSLKSLTRYIQRSICQPSDHHCLHSASLLTIASTVDMDYDSISHTLTLTAHWAQPPTALLDPITNQITENAWSISVSSPPGAEKVEIGILSNAPSTDPSELTLSGFLTVVGEDDHPHPTLFSFPSRHRLLPASQATRQRYRISFPPPTGLHPTLQISFADASALLPPSINCALHTYLTLPSALFADKYQLSTPDPVFLRAHNLIALRSISGETNLEAPDYLVEKWGSSLLVEVATPDLNSNPNSNTDWNITIPLHLRYLAPSSTTTPIQIPWPILFWACPADAGSKFPVNPFDRTNLGYEAVFGVRTMFWHLDPDPAFETGGVSSMVEEIYVPVLDTAAWGPAGGVEWGVEWGTVVVVVLGFAWVCWKLLLGGGGGGGSGADSAKGKDSRTETKKQR